ncbi:hypothetical protein ACM66Z_03505 [Sulfurovum sp. ST-21]|uniref:Uncharacterized protein n=1 Tax=Sulfurovum indicum TaxID=2779528 RepID=A0A7M1S5W2_9BACT|nr:hypothetical protein [Sulfurovum indicum]QOR62544.1 hypothetical protein IMZ28_03485 [Sulfurovum indicum]
MKEYSYLILTILALFGIILAGAYFSPTFEEQKSFLELFYLSGALLFIFSALVIFATIGFGSFAIYGAVFLAAVMGIYGIEGALLITGMTYFVWGSIFAMQVLLFYHHLKSATQWFKERYTFNSFKYEYYIFYPMLWIAYLFLEFIPSILFREDFLRFIPSKILKEMKEVLE